MVNMSSRLISGVGPGQKLDSEEQEAEKPGPKPRARRRLMGLWTFVSAFFVVVFLGLVVLSLSGRVLTAPGWVARYIENQINDSFQAGRIHVGQLQLQVNRAGVPQVALRNLGVFDANGNEIARLNSVAAGFSPIQILRGVTSPKSLRVRGAEITARRRIDGQFALSFGGNTGTTNSLPGLLDTLDMAFSQTPLDQVTLLSADALTISIEDARSGQFWQVTDGQLDVRRTETGLDISIAFDVFNGTEELAEIVIGIGTQSNSSQARIGTSFKNATARDIAAQSPALSFLSVIDAPISGSVRADFDGQGTLGTLDGTLGFGTGALEASVDVEPVKFQSAKTYFSFDPIKQKLEFSEVSLASDAVNLRASGHAYLQDFKDGWPAALIGQFTLSDLMADPVDLYENPIRLTGGATDFRLRLDPFSVDVGQMVILDDEQKLVASGKLSTQGNGWSLGGDLMIDNISRERLLELWPVATIPNTRKWVRDHVTGGTFSNVRMATRTDPNGNDKRLISWEFSDTSVLYLKAQPPIENASGYATIDGNAMTVVIESGAITPPLGAPIEMAGSVVNIPNVSIKPATAELRLAGTSEIRSILSLMDMAPFKVLKNANFGPDIAAGVTSFTAEISFPLIKNLDFKDVTYSADASLFNISTTDLIPGRSLTGQRLEFHADNAGLEISGPAKLGQVATNMVWHQKSGPDQVGRSNVTGTVELSQAFVDEFGINLPANTVQGAGIGQFEVLFEPDQPPRFTLASDLNRLGLRIPQVGWSKPKNSTGRLWVAGSLGPNLAINAMELKSGDLNAAGGRVSFNANGSMRNVRFERVRFGGWLDAPIVLTARGRGSPAISITGGTMDIRKTTFGGGSGANSTGGSGGPLTLQFDRVIISESISLTNFNSDLNTQNGLSGAFSARINGKVPVTGTLAPSTHGTSIQLNSDNGGAVLRDAGVVEYAQGGSLVLTLIPRAGNGLYTGQLRIKSTRVKNAPGLTDLLSAISIVGLLDQMDGGGISFDTMEADFTLSPRAVNVSRSSAVGPSLGVSLDGVYDLQNSQMNMQGVVSPVYFLNAIGEIFTRKGEGLFGFSYTLTGSSAAPKVKVNPLSILTPGLFREIFRAQPPKSN